MPFINKYLLLTMFLAMLGTGCASSNMPKAASSSEQMAVGKTWNLVAFGADTETVLAETAITLTFLEDGKIAGSAGCNRYFGSYERNDQDLTFSQIGATRMACPPPVMEQEQRFLAALESVVEWDRQGDHLDLKDDDGERLLRFLARPGSSQERTTLTGEVYYRPRIALPPDAVLHVRLLDVSRADAPALTLAEQTIQTEGRQVPIPFSLSYDVALIEPRHRYAVRAKIRDGEGKLMWTSDTTHPVITQNAPSDKVSIEVVQVAAGTDRNSALAGPTWHLVQIEKGDGTSVTPEADKHYTITFGADARYNGQADCNRYGGEYEIEDDGELELDQGLSTLAACPPPSSSIAFFGVLAEIERYAVAGSRLTLHGDAGSLVFEQSDFGGMEPQETVRTFVYECSDPDDENFSFSTRTGPGELALWLPERFGSRYLVLGQVRAASGAKYQDGDVVVWTKGNEALLEVNGETFTGCKLNPQRSVWEDAKLSGVDFRAIGQEPGWHLEITEQKWIRFVYNYGEQEAITPVPEPEVDQAARQTVYHAETEAHKLTVLIEDKPCTDSMSGEAFESTVSVELDGETYRGCGRALH